MHPISGAPAHVWSTDPKSPSQIWFGLHVPQLPLGGGVQSALDWQPRKGSALQNVSNGPASQTPSFGLGSPVSLEHTPSAHWFGAVGCPGRPHAPLGHSDETVQTFDGDRSYRATTRTGGTSNGWK